MCLSSYFKQDTRLPMMYIEDCLRYGSFLATSTRTWNINLYWNPMLYIEIDEPKKFPKITFSRKAVICIMPIFVFISNMQIAMGIHDSPK